MPVAIVLNVPERVCQERNRSRPDRNFGPHVVRQQSRQMRRSLRGLKKEGFRHVHVLSPDEIESAELERQPLWSNRRHEHGPFDIVGDVHGCRAELEALLRILGYEIARMPDGNGGLTVVPPVGRKAVFVGDLVDRGSDIPGVLKVVMSMVETGAALCVPGNHEIKLLRKLRGKDVKVAHGLAESIEQLGKETPKFREKVARL